MSKFQWKQKTGQLRLPWAKILATVIVIFLISNFVQFWFHKEIMVLDFYTEMSFMELEKTNAFVHSSYYFENSKS